MGAAARVQLGQRRIPVAYQRSQRSEQWGVRELELALLEALALQHQSLLETRPHLRQQPRLAHA
jgi:hypothetical protein